jgi:hypothetical protein
MQLISWTNPKMIICSEGKMIRSKNDIYSPAKYDEQGNMIEPEHISYYTTTIFVPDNFTEEQMNELYVEEEIKESEV